MEKVKVLLYCNKAKPYIGSHTEYNGERKQENGYRVYTPHIFNNKPYYNGKIVAECDFEVECYDTSWYCSDFIEHKGLEKSCLTKEQLFDYVKGRNEFYALHISNLKIFDKPLELKDTYTRECNWNKCSKCEYGKDGNIKCCTIDIPLSKAHPNMMWVWYKGERYVLISIRPQCLCKILNGEKTIEVRRKVLKGMVK